MDVPDRGRRPVSTAGLLVALLAASAAATALLPARGAPPRVPGPWPVPVQRRHGPLVDRLGTRAARLVRLPDEPGTARRLGRAVLAGLVAAPLAPPVAVALPAGAIARTLVLRQRSARRRRQQVLASLPDAVDLLLLCTTAGMGTALAHAEVARRMPGPVGDALRAAQAGSERGHPRADALVAALSPHGERATALGHVLADHLRYGTPLGPELDRLGLELRLDRRRAAEEEARRVPVRLLAPLVTCTLPAFALLTVAPLLLASLRHLPT
jgi:hypothetical protein